MPLDAQHLEEALQLVGELLDSRRTERFRLVVCGGSALLAQNLISRPTNDVDILALMSWEQEVSSAHPLPSALNRTEPRDLNDLTALTPSADETEEAVCWLLTAIPGLTQAHHLPDLLIHLGHADLIPRLQG
ncbi:MAG: hypothetical protein O3A87_05645 [Verrucomicrobia bacterium]|nr:hypothetical protein [Verrucomicrobiota bacterium]MDA1005951.1 hypothetical protein [Verrucomicrobiota bacterium]